MVDDGALGLRKLSALAASGSSTIIYFSGWVVFLNSSEKGEYRGLVKPQSKYLTLQ